MCCFFTSLMLLGPRFGILAWWLYNQSYFNRAFDTFIWPLLGWLFLPWTTLMYLIVYPGGGIDGFDWVLLALAVMSDLATYSGGAYGNREQLQGYYSRQY